MKTVTGSQVKPDDARPRAKETFWPRWHAEWRRPCQLARLCLIWIVSLGQLFLRFRPAQVFSGPATDGPDCPFQQSSRGELRAEKTRQYDCCRSARTGCRSPDFVAQGVARSLRSKFDNRAYARRRRSICCPFRRACCSLWVRELRT